MAETFKSYYAIIPANVRYDKELKDKAKLLYGEITALCNEKGYCWAKNNYFAELYGVSKETISRLVSNLADKGYVRVEIIYEGKQIVERRIHIAQPEILTQKSIPIDEKINTPPIDNSVNTPIDKKRNTPIDENVKDNNTKFFNNKSFNNQSINQEDDPDEISITTDVIDEDEIINYEEVIAKNIDYENMKSEYGEIYESIYNIMIDVIYSSDDALKIGRNYYPIERVIDRLLTLNSKHIEYIINCLNGTTPKNYIAYILTCLYNAPATIGVYNNTKNNTAKKQDKPNKFHNFEGKIKNYTEEELEQMLKNKFTNNLNPNE